MEVGNQNFVLKVSADEIDKVSVHTPGNFKLSDIKKETLEFTDKSIVMKSTYPNGFTIMLHQSAKEIYLISNRPLKANDDGSFTAPTDEPL